MLDRVDSFMADSSFDFRVAISPTSTVVPGDIMEVDRGVLKVASGAVH